MATAQPHLSSYRKPSRTDPTSSWQFPQVPQPFQPPPRGLPPQPLRSVPEELSLLIVPAVRSRDHPTPVHQDAGAVEREAIEEGHLPGLRAVRASAAEGPGARECVVSGEQQSLRDWRKKGGGDQSRQDSRASSGLGIRVGPWDGASGGHSLNPRVCVEIGDPEGTEWKWAEKNGVKGQGGGDKNGGRRPNRLGLEEQGRCRELEEVRIATRRGRRGGAKAGGAERGGDRKQPLVGESRGGNNATRRKKGRGQKTLWQALG